MCIIVAKCANALDDSVCKLLNTTGVRTPYKQGDRALHATLAIR